MASRAKERTNETREKARQERIKQVQIKQAQIKQAGITQTMTVPRGKDRNTQIGAGTVGTTTTIGLAQDGQGEPG